MPWEPPLLEREHETDVLEAALAHVATARSGRMVLIESDAGLGKSRLLRQLRQAAVRRGHGVLAARGSRLEHSFGFGVVRQLLGAGGLVDTDEPGDLARMDAMFWLLADRCREPSVMVVDDLHLADAESLRFLEHLRTRLDDVPLLLAVSTDVAGPGTPPAVRSLRTDPEVLVVRPRPLGLMASARLLASLLGSSVDPAFAEASRRRTGGNPLLLSLLDGSLDGGPTDEMPGVGTEPGTRVGDVVRHQLAPRLDGLDPDVRRVAEAVAALGEAPPADLVAAVVGTSAEVALERAAVLADQALLERLDLGSDTGLSARHPLIADAVTALMVEAHRQELFLRCADLLDTRGAPAEQVAAQVLRLSPGVDPAATERLLRGADESERRGALESSVTCLERCLEEDLEPGARLQVLSRAGSISLHADLGAGISFLERAVETPDGRHSPELWARLATAYGYLRHPGPALGAMERAVALLPVGDEDRRRQWEASLLVGSAITHGGRELDDELRRLRDLPPAQGVGARLLEAALAFYEMATCDPAGAVRARTAVSDGLLVAQANGDGALVCAWVTLVAADDPLALESLDAAVAQAQADRTLRSLAAATTFRALALLRQGRPVDAAEDARQGLAHALRGRVDVDSRLPGACLAHALIEAGDPGAAESTLRSVRGFVSDDAAAGYVAREAAARLRRLQGRPAEAQQIAEAVGVAWSAYGLENPALGLWRSEAALASYTLGRIDHAIELARADLERAERWGAPGARSRALRTLGVVSGGSDDLLAEAVAVAEDTPARLELIESLAARGGALRRAGEREASRELLSRALDLAERCGAIRLVDEALSELRRAGFRPRRNLLTGPDSLTLSERRVAELAAGGATNRDIAQGLFVSQKTVELHLTNVYRKLGVGGRHGLERALATGSTPA